ncbi:MAG TPA: hypothetical protein VF893_04670 [Candidatus Bathyarchaeia archaeon]
MVSAPSEEKRRQRRYAIYATILATGFTAFLAIIFIDEGIIPQDYLTYIVAFWAMLWIITILCSVIRDRGKNREGKWYADR